MTEQTPAIDDVLAELERTSRLKQRRATYFLIALVGCGLLLLGLISYRIQSAYKELSGISQSVETLRIEKTKLEAEKKTLEADKKVLEKDKQLLSGAVRSLDTEAHPTAGTVTPSPAQNALPARVYIHIAREDQRPKARELSRALFAKGYVAPGIELVPKPPNQTVVKFFREGERNIAEDVLSSLQAVRVANAKIDFLPGFENRVRPKHFEVWFGSAE